MKKTPHTLDLHGVKHEDVPLIVENFVLSHQHNMPLEIIYGNSVAMMRLVIKVLEKRGAVFNSGYKNQYGRLLVLGWENDIR